MDRDFQPILLGLKSLWLGEFLKSAAPLLECLVDSLSPSGFFNPLSRATRLVLDRSLSCRWINDCRQSLRTLLYHDNAFLGFVGGGRASPIG
jgi:hypothetical protein